MRCAMVFCRNEAVQGRHCKRCQTERAGRRNVVASLTTTTKTVVVMLPWLDVMDWIFSYRAGGSGGGF